jgi:hypothetical protein
MEAVGIFYGHLSYLFRGNLKYFMVIWYIFYPSWYVVPRKIWQPCWPPKKSISLHKTNVLTCDFSKNWMEVQLDTNYFLKASTALRSSALQRGKNRPRGLIIFPVFVWARNLKVMAASLRAKRRPKSVPLRFPLSDGDVRVQRKFLFETCGSRARCYDLKKLSPKIFETKLPVFTHNKAR